MHSLSTRLTNTSARPQVFIAYQPSIIRLMKQLKRKAENNVHISGNDQGYMLKIYMKVLLISTADLLRCVQQLTVKEEDIETDYNVPRF